MAESNIFLYSVYRVSVAVLMRRSSTSLSLFELDTNLLYICSRYTSLSVCGDSSSSGRSLLPFLNSPSFLTIVTEAAGRSGFREEKRKPRALATMRIVKTLGGGRGMVELTHNRNLPTLKRLKLPRSAYRRICS